MAVSQRNFLPAVFVLVGLGLFAFFGFGNSEVAKIDPPAIPRDEAAIDEVARLAAEEDVEDGQEAEEGEKGGEEDGGGDSDRRNAIVSSAPQLKNPESERLNLSGQTVDNSVPIRSADGKFDITFDHIKFDIPEDEPYSPALLTEQIRQLDGQQVKLRGFIRPSFKQRDLKNFIFVRDDKECCFGPGAALFDCVVVKLAKNTTTDYTVRPVAVTGKFLLKEYKGPDGNVWAIYRMRDAAVTK
jgi:hypothetical protein